jgi:diacylglycerol kinase
VSLIPEPRRRAVLESAFKIIAFLIVMVIAWHLPERPLLVWAMMMAAFLMILVFVPDSILEKILQFFSKRR